ncbi:hypothetical protein BR93DRAFT_921704 [Coniochaeta sp. PMI_546]|nr:hypothetical protein BR93DRAFT_921704 [Coniochaeta sp. PMI_546]
MPISSDQKQPQTRRLAPHCEPRRPPRPLISDNAQPFQDMMLSITILPSTLYTTA